jgi:large repetitive protein
MRSGRVARVALGAAVLALACGGEDPQPSGAPLARERTAPSAERVENEPPVVEELVLNPPAPLPGQQIEARVEVSDPDGDPIRLELEWRQNGRVIATGAHSTLAPEGLAKGDEIAVFATATDGRATSDPVRASVTVGNTPPLIRAFYLAPDGEIAPGQEVTAAPQALDPDGDELDFEFEWLLNGARVRGAEEATFDTSKLKRGDRLQAHVRVTDGEEWSPVAESMTLTLANRPPRFAALPPIESSNGAVHANLTAEDPDGDKTLRFRLIEGPKGLTVDPVSGSVSWRPGADAIGTHAVEVAVADAQGAESAMRFELNVAGGAPEAKAPPAKRAEGARSAAAASADDGEDADASEADEDAEPEAEE